MIGIEYIKELFEKYNIDDLFLASVRVIYPENNLYNIDGIIMMGIAGYGYLTILKKEDDKYIDLCNRKVKISEERDSNKTSYIIDYIEPFNEYYNLDGDNLKMLSKRKVLTEAKKYYDDMHQKHINK